jgi:glucose/arabinose dehydrogenase
MNKKIVLIAIAIFLIIIIASIFGIKPAVKSVSLDGINLPRDFKIDVFADTLDGSSISYPDPNSGPRMMLLRDNVLFVTIPNTGKVVALPDENGDKKADRVVTFIDKLNNPHGIDYFDGWFYIA